MRQYVLLVRTAYKHFLSRLRSKGMVLTARGDDSSERKRKDALPTNVSNE